MQELEALRIVRSLADGIDPNGGGPLPDSSLCQHPRVIRALYMAAEELERRVQRVRRTAGLPDNAGQPWDEEEDQRLRDGWEAGLGVRELARRHGRTDGAIKRRLEKLDLVRMADEPPRARRAQRRHGEERWTGATDGRTSSSEPAR